MSELRTLWYMGAKTRLIPEFIEGAVGDLLPPGGRVLDLCAGTSAVARSLATRYRVYANDVQQFSQTIAYAHLCGDDAWISAMDHLNPESDLEAAYQKNLEHLQSLLGPALHCEERLLKATLKELEAGDVGAGGEEYRSFCKKTPLPFTENQDVDPDYQPFGSRLPGLLRERQRDAQTFPYLLVSSYSMNIYFGIRQSTVVDSLRYAIDQISASDPQQQQKQKLYLAALIYACSVSTSGTSHFAQPRSISKDSELQAVCKRRSLDIELEFHKALDSIRREWGERPRLSGNRAYSKTAVELLASDGPLGKDGVDLVYLDPPYTSDNYSRFYHLLETIDRYDYPELQLKAGELTRGRYPVRTERFQSDFCSGPKVEAAFRSAAKSVSELGAKLIVSYSANSGLLIKHWSKHGEAKPLNRFLALFRDYFEDVEIRQRDLMHSGQGDSNKEVRELLVLCDSPRQGSLDALSGE